MNASPNPIAAVAGMIAARRVRSPQPSGSATVDHEGLAPILDALRRGGVPALSELGAELDEYQQTLELVDPDELTGPEALAFWMNLYNLGALMSARDASVAGMDSMLRIPSVFGRKWTTIAGESLSLDDIEHGKVRRFGDPRIHAALVCGSVSCPTLRFEPFVGARIDDQLDDQMRRFLAAGGAAVDVERGVIQMSRIFLWYGRDFTRPDTMPNLAPASSARVRDTVAWWLDPTDRDQVWTTEPDVEYMAYDWGLGCTVA